MGPKFDHKTTSEHSHALKIFSLFYYKFPIIHKYTRYTDYRFIEFKFITQHIREQIA